MKKMILVLIAAALVAMIGCKEETTLKWNNQSNETASEITWVADGGDDVSWGSETVADNATSSSKEIKDRSGVGQCHLSGDSAGVVQDIVWDQVNSYTAISLSEGSSETYTIYDTTAK
jgi:hypothetical protein